MDTAATTHHHEEELTPIVYPNTLAAGSIILGDELSLLGSVELVDAATEEDVTARTLQAVLALVALIAGVVVLRRPAETLVVVLLAAGLCLLVAGLVSVVRAVVNVRYRGTSLMRVDAGGGEVKTAFATEARGQHPRARPSPAHAESPGAPRLESGRMSVVA